MPVPWIEPPVAVGGLGGRCPRPEPVMTLRHPHELSAPLVAVVVLVIAMGLEGYALRTAMAVAAKTRGSRNWWQFVRHAKSPEVPTILLEDAGAVTGLAVALIGVTLTVATGRAVFDAVSTLVIGVLLV